ncbi:DUF3575 domain-containing protein [Pedobacter sp. HDW13]|uniref:DUF3575 domain-containing protein n=1 Tax=unclassified Pedobacter TaxID=2628915 RepID=UPI000F5ABD50|nr:MULTISPECIES: DUF3575 domain-containing protein [unclassified Pedobacter]QIL41721.1 DUF3575 domain-containing protein [Pedobacter sp. HDW13]RQO73498.1 hypothetical protein DBR40_14225 [Pedobacter sp. KBW01]
MKKVILMMIFGTFTLVVKSQERIGLLIKTNALNVLAKRPAISVEKTFDDKYGLELSYTSGELNWGRNYKFNGFVLRAKIYADKIEANTLIPFYGLYVGNLEKRIFSSASVDNTGFVSIGRNRNFEANSFRSGINIGFLFIPQKRFILEGTTALGYGKYFNVKNYISKPAPKGYLDFQLWLSAGYYF